jgi:hypothetical protein
MEAGKSLGKLAIKEDLRPEMQPSPASHPPQRFDPIGQPFRVLRIDPSATADQVAAAYALAVSPNKDQAEASQDNKPSQGVLMAHEALADARKSILDIDGRLSCELAFPIDSAAVQIELFYAALDRETPASELMQIAHGLGPLSRANFFAGSRRPLEGPELLAFLEAQAAVDANEIYVILKGLRYRAGIAPPSLASVSQGLRDLYAAQGEAILSIYESAQRAEALSECTKTVLSSGERYRIEALSGLLSIYRRSTDTVRSKANADLREACESLQRQPDDAPSIERLTAALSAWALLCQPLMALDAQRGHHDEDIEFAIDHVRALLADLSVSHHFEAFRVVIDLARTAFGSMPRAIEQFEKAALLVQRLGWKSEIKVLEAAIERAIEGPDLVVALEAGFGEKSTTPALELWLAFDRTIKATKASQYADRPWTLIHDLASRLADHPENVAAASVLLSDAIRQAEDDQIDPALTGLLRADLHGLQSRYPPAPSGKQRASGRFGQRALLAGSTLITLVCFVFLYRHFGPVFSGLTPPTSDPSMVVASTPPNPEVIPPVATGQRLELSSVRYCRFQEERLRIVKRHVTGTEDVRAFNVLASDYNSRCSDFFFQDKDQNTVLQELGSQTGTLEADAMRILATWPWHAANGNTASPK